MTLYIHDVIGHLRSAHDDLRREIHAMRLQLHLLEVYLAKISDYPAPPTGDVSRETEADGNGSIVHETLF